MKFTAVPVLSWEFFLLPAVLQFSVLLPFLVPTPMPLFTSFYLNYAFFLSDSEFHLFIFFFKSNLINFVAKYHNS